MNEKVYIKKKYEDWVMIILLLLLLSFSYFTKSNQYILEIFITAFFIISGIWFIFFDIKKLEKFLIGNFTKIIFSIILILTFTKFSYIEISKEVMYLIGGLFAFWYGYKKYERDKELELLNNFTRKYLIIKDDIEKNKKKSVEKQIQSYTSILHLWNKQYFLKYKGYISNDLWEEYNTWITRDIHEILDDTYKNIKKDINQRYDGKVGSVEILDCSPFLLSMKEFMFFTETYKVDDDDFFTFLMRKIKRYELISRKIHKKSKIKIKYLDGLKEYLYLFANL